MACSTRSTRLSVADRRVRGGRRAALVTALCAFLALLGAAPAGAAVPREWFGVMADGPLLLDARVDLDAEMAEMRRTGVGSIRLAVYWSDIEKTEGQFDWSDPDRVMAAAARAGIRALPTVLRTPRWAAARPGKEGTHPKDVADYARFLRAAVSRYGSGGTFWTERPDLTALPPRMWMLWNEPDIDKYWTARPWIPTYLKLLRAGRGAVKGADAKAKVVLAGLTNRSWEELAAIYRAGGRKAFDVAAIHPFSRRPANVLKIVRLARRAMVRGGDRRKPLLLTEVTWSSGKGRSKANYGWETTESGQAERVRQALPLLARNRKRLGIAGIYWFTWLSPSLGSVQSFDYAGLRRMKNGVPTAKPAQAAYRSVARKLTR